MKVLHIVTGDLSGGAARGAYWLHLGLKELQEHIPDDKKAMNELYRVLKSGGWASIKVPVKGDVTQQDLSVTDPKERLRLYGQDDHVRYYGYDFTDRLKDAGFKVMMIPKNDLLNPAERARMSLDLENEVILCRKIISKKRSIN